MNYLNNLKPVLRRSFRPNSRYLIAVNYSKEFDPKDISAVYNEDEEGKLSIKDILVSEDDVDAREKEIERMRNKSRLSKHHRNFLFSKPTALEDLSYDKTLYASRRDYGLHGGQSGVDPRLCFPTPEEIADKLEYEQVAFPLTIPQMIEMNKQAKAEKKKQRKEREDQVAKNLLKLDKWMEDLNTRIEKKQQEALAARQKREQFMDEIRQELGFKVDQRDPRFKELIERKELEQKKAKKAEKKKQREEIMIEKLRSQAEETLKEAKVKETKPKIEIDEDENDAESSDSDNENAKEEEKDTEEEKNDKKKKKK